MEKVIKNGLVAVIYSPGFGAGWYTWNQCRINFEYAAVLLFDPILVDLVIQKQANEYDGDACNAIKKQIVARAEELCPEGYYGGVDNLVIEWIPIGSQFIVNEYDGSESIQHQENDYWITA